MAASQLIGTMVALTTNPRQKAHFCRPSLEPICCMKIYLIAMLGLLLSGAGVSQTLETTLMQGIPVIKYRLGAKESSFDVYKKFGMEDSSFIQLNQTNDSLEPETINVTVKNVLLAECNGTGCIELRYTASDGDNFKKIGSYFGNLSPYLIKRLNPTLEAVTTGKSVIVGYLPANLYPGEPLQPKDSVSSVNAGSHVTVEKQPGVAKMDTASKAAIPTMPYSGAGFYAAEFREPGDSLMSGKVSNFKSFGGWYDGKFYILVNGIATGKVVKVINVQNGLYIYARVVSALPDLKNEKNLIARINNAACAALDIWDDAEFDVQIRF